METIEKEYISERQLAIASKMSVMTILRWRRKGFFAGLFVEKKYHNAIRFFYLRDESLLKIEALIL